MSEKKRLHTRNILEYVEHEDTVAIDTITNIVPLLQDDYGEANDCTLTSITSIIKRFKESVEIEDIYTIVESIARRYGYRGNIGTLSAVIRTVYQKSLNTFKINKTASSCFIKGLGYNYNTIKTQIAKDNPILLNLWKDGRGYYENHSVLITGYYETTTHHMIKIQDNWYKDPSFIDYDKLSLISSIQILK